VQAGGQVATWMDLTGNGNDATQAVIGYRPTYTATGINGFPSVTFQGPITFLRIADAASMQWGTGDFLVEAVVRCQGQSAPDAMLYQKTEEASPWNGASLYLNADKPMTTALAAGQASGTVYVVSAPPPTTFDDGSVHLLGVRRSGNTLEVRVDGAPSSIMNASVGTINVSVSGADAIIGQNGSQGGATPTSEFQQLWGDIAEMVGVGGALNQTELSSLEQYLKARYAIP
jgi:hypothetical protein